MAECKYCGTKGWLNKVDSNGLCSRCEIVYLPIITNRSLQVIESGQIISKSKNISTILTRIRFAIQCLEELEVYHLKGIPTISSPPRNIIKELEIERSKVLDEFILEQKTLTRAAAKNASTPASKLGGYKKALGRMENLLIQVPDLQNLKLALEKIRSERDILRAKMSKDKADIWISKGKVEKALEILIDAKNELTQNKTLDIDRQETIAVITKMIEETRTINNIKH
jgi:hypothetical protein